MAICLTSPTIKTAGTRSRNTLYLCESIEGLDGAEGYSVSHTSPL